MRDLLEQHVNEIKKLDQSRMLWLHLSSYIVISILIFLANWIFLDNNVVYLIVTASGLILTITWWYWTMKMIRQLLNHRITEAKILKAIIHDIRDVKKEIKKIDDCLLY